MRALLICVLAFMAMTAAAAEPVKIGFGDLPDPEAQAFHDPFREMGRDNLANLKTVVRLRERLAAEDVDPQARPRLEARLSAISRALKAKGFDIDGLIAQRWEIARKRRAALRAANPALDGAEVSLSGYLIPAPRKAGETAFGYLVAAVGLCSHLPPPPPNQLVRVSLDENSLPDATPYTPLQITGTLRADASDRRIFFLDGEIRMDSMWTLNAEDIVVVKQTLRPAAKTIHDPRFVPSQWGLVKTR